jgi:NADH-quinone oxidoreductase subunit K
MNNIPLEHGLIVAAILFGLGFTGVMVRRNILFMLISVEIMMNAAALAFVIAGSRWAQADGQVMFILILTLAAAEVSIGLALMLRLYHRHHSLDIDLASEMRE